MSISEERKNRVTDVYYIQGKTTHEIVKIERMCIRDIYPIISIEEATRQKYKYQQREEYLPKPMSYS
jgi:hypothetical protein